MGLDVAWAVSKVKRREKVPRRRLIRVIIASLVVIGLANIWSPGDPTVTERALASAIILIAAWLVASRSSTQVFASPFVALFACVFALYFAVPIFLLEHYSPTWYAFQPIPDAAIESALWLALGGLMCCLGGYWVGVTGRIPGLPGAIGMHWSHGAAVRLGVVFGMVGLVAYVAFEELPIPLGIQQLMNYMVDLSLFGILVLWVLQLKGHLGIAGTLVLWTLLVPWRVMLGLGTGRTAQAVEVGLAAIVAYSLVRDRIPWKTCASVFIGMLVLLPVRQDFRELTWSGSDADLALTSKAILYPRVAADYLASADARDSLQVAMSRLAHLMTFAEVVEKTPGDIGYWEGETYRALLYKIIPRAVYPDKPTIETGQLFGHRYGFLSPTDRTTSYNLPQLVELYANFGIVGVLVGMFVVGVIYAAIVRCFGHRDGGLGSQVAGAYVMAKLLLIESSAALVFGGLAWNIVFVGCLHWCVRVVDIRQVRAAPMKGGSN